MSDGVDIDAIHYRNDHGRAGGPTALLLLRALCACPAGCSIGELSALARLPAEICALGLRGLQHRGRAVCVGTTRSARWYVPHHIKAPKT